MTSCTWIFLKRSQNTFSFECLMVGNRGINNPIWDSAKDMEAKITKAYGLDENK